MAEKRNRFESITVIPSTFQSSVEHGIENMRAERIMERIRDHDHTVWSDDPREITNRLGWLHSPDVMADAVPEITAFVDDVRSQGYRHALLLGMGGSSLAPEVFRHAFGVSTGYLDLSVLDSTDPGAVLHFRETLDPATTLFIVSTKSGETVETLSFMKYFYRETTKALGPEEGKRHFIAIIDPGSGLESAATDLGFRKIFLNDPDIGGRYSALSYFGLVPAALIGCDLHRILDRAASMSKNSAGWDGAAARLGAALGIMARAGRDKLTLVLSPAIAPFGPWVEQLIAESTGKQGTGILPVDGEEPAPPETYANDRLFVCLELGEDSAIGDRMKAIAGVGHPVVHIKIDDLYGLGGQFFLWEVATTVAGWYLGINPFDQPDVESAKVLARSMVAEFKQKGKLPEPAPAFQADGISVYTDVAADSLEEATRAFMSDARQGIDEGAGRSYIAIQAYLEPSAETTALLQDLRAGLQRSYRLATTVGYGPRFLHSTGQLHKGDGGNGMFFQITADTERDAAIPDQAESDTSSITFGVLKAAQASGDRQALIDGGRHVIRFHLGNDVAGGLRRLARAVKNLHS